VRFQAYKFDVSNLKFIRPHATRSAARCRRETQTRERTNPRAERRERGESAKAFHRQVRAMRARSIWKVKSGNLQSGSGNLANWESGIYLETEIYR